MTEPSTRASLLEDFAAPTLACFSRESVASTAPLKQLADDLQLSDQPTHGASPAAAELQVAAVLGEAPRLVSVPNDG